ncbi:Probable acetolactate synthase large subunit [Geodia barretti]|uniref:Probable acetolactate synthase large subunit n=1 Tax=Geodia barretti TaxID=519541 RepID=A0AA35WU14_GEOBA|nr:Probable acetolactate synthase large subunit [Geodia barretti]
MTGNQAIAKILKAEGLDWFACFPHHSLIDAAAKEGLRPILTRQERAGVNMADGYSRIMSGNRIGVFMMQDGPGAENAFGGVAQAYADSVPILLLPGGPRLGNVGMHPGFVAHRNYGGVTKWTEYISQADRIPQLMRMAFTRLKHGRPGPVLLEIPTDVAEQELSDNAFDYTPVQVRKSAADPDDVRDLVTALLKASCPVISAGRGILYAEATQELVTLSELTNIPVMTTLQGKSGFPENHPLALGTAGGSGTRMAGHFLKQTDFVLGIATTLSGGYSPRMPAGVTLAQITNSTDDLNVHYRLAYGAVGDAKLVLQQMIEELGYGLGLALGAKVAAPEKLVINVMGDAAFGMAGLDIETAVRSEIPILTVVLNNGIMTHYNQNMPYASEHWDSDKLSGDYAKVAESLGAFAETVVTPDQLPGAIARAIAATKEGRPALLQTMTCGEETVSQYQVS